MDLGNKKTTVPNPSVAADGEQPILNCSDVSISETPGEINSQMEMLRELRKLYDPDRLHTVSMTELYENVYESKPAIIDGLLYPGTYLFVGPPKVGKSFLMAQIAYHVSMGLPLWENTVRQGTVLYLALEDDYRRLQSRLYRMFGTEGTEKLHFAICVKQLGQGLNTQLERFVTEHPDTNLIIIDTLQRIRETGSDKYSYASDYELMKELKRLSDQRGICLLLVHHTRKQPAEDKFDMISGTNGLLGASDGAFLLQKEKRTGDEATLDISARDQPEQRFYLKRDAEHLFWTLLRVENEPWKEPPDPVLESVVSLIQSTGNWIGTPSELVSDLGLTIKPNKLTQHLNVQAGRLKNEYGIHYESCRTHSGRSIKLSPA